MRYYPSFNDVFDDLFDTESRNPTRQIPCYVIFVKQKIVMY